MAWYDGDAGSCRVSVWSLNFDCARSGKYKAASSQGASENEGASHVLRSKPSFSNLSINSEEPARPVAGAMKPGTTQSDDRLAQFFYHVRRIHQVCTTTISQCSRALPAPLS